MNKLTTEERRELKKLWLTFLKRRDIRQGRGELRTSDNCFCVLGALCEVYRTSRFNDGADRYEWNENNEFSNGKNDAADCAIPFYLAERIGIAEYFEVKTDGRKNKIAITSLNDWDRLSFDELIPIIEANF